MKKYIFLLAISSIITNATFALANDKFDDYLFYKEKQKLLDKKLQQTSQKVDNQQKELNRTISKLDSLRNEINQVEINLPETKQIAIQNRKQIKNDRENLNNGLKKQRNVNIILFSTLCIVILGNAVCFFYLIKKSSNSSVEKMMCLDTKLLDVLNRQIDLQEHKIKEETNGLTKDHSLALNVANEIVRIEMNLYRMDQSTRGYKQLLKSISRIRENYQSKGYEISELLGQKYNIGMRVIANFIQDETLPEGSQIITGIKKAQVLFNGVMIQAAEITVSQNI